MLGIKKIRRAMVLGVAVALSAAPALTSYADTPPSPEEVWASQFPGHEDAATSELVDTAQNLGIPPEQLAQDLLTRESETAAVPLAGMPLVARGADNPARAAARWLRRQRAGRVVRSEIVERPASYDDDDPYISGRLSSGSGGDGVDRVPLVKADDRGDILFYNVSTLGFWHNHVGIYRWRGYLVEAANKNLGVRKIAVENRKVPKDDTGLMWVDLAYDRVLRSEHAGDWSDNAVGDAYRDWYDLHNKYQHAPWNCAQLVWTAYAKQDAWLDADGGDYVWPNDIVDDSRTWFYKTL